MAVRIFVFGSNLSGIHGAGAAAHAYKVRGAVWGQGVGLAGESYAIPTKNYAIHTLPLDVVEDYVADFIEFAEDHPELEFEVTAIGCGLAGFTPEQIAPFFVGVPGNCVLPASFAAVIDWRGRTWIS